MFYAHIVLAKKGPLARIWLAAHWDKKITKAHVFETNIEQSVDGIMQPKVKLALRTSGHLLLGVVRIYARKAKYLLADCNEAFVKIKMAFRPGMVDLPEEHREAAVNAITLPEVFHDFDTPVPEMNDVDIEAHFSINQSRADEITMREDYGTLPMNIHDDGFGDMGFDDTPDIVRDRLDESMEGLNDELVTEVASTTRTANTDEAEQDGGMDGSGKEKSDKKGLRPRAKSLYEELSEQPAQDTRWNEYLDDLFTDPVAPPPDLEQEKEPLPGTSHSILDSFDPHHPHGIDNDGFGDEGFGAEPAAGLFEGDIFADAPLAPEPDLPAAPTQAQQSGAAAATAAAAADEDSDDDDDDHFDVGGAPSPAPSSDNSRPPSPIITQPLLDDLQQPGTSQDAAPSAPVSHEVPADVEAAPVVSEPQPEEPERRNEPEEEHIGDDIAGEEDVNAEQTTLLQNEEESFALAPVDASALKGVTKSKRKRKLIVDEIKNISGEEMKSQLANTSDIVTTLDLAPPTKRLMYWKETGGVEKLFALPSRDIPARCMFKNYQRHLTSRSIGIEDFSVLGPLDVLGVEQQQPERPESPVTQRRGRKRRIQQQEIYAPDTPATPMIPMTPATPVMPPTPGHMDQSSVDQMREAVEMPPPTPISMELREQEICQDVSQSFHPDGSMMPPPATPGISNIGSPNQTPLNLGMQTPLMMPLTPGIPSIPMTPGSLEHSGLTPVGLPHGSLTPGDLHHGGLTPAGLLHGGMTPAGLQHGGLTPTGLHHGGMTPAGLHHGGMTPAGLHHGGMTPAGLQHGDSGHVMPDLPGAMTPHGLDHGGMTPHHSSLENIDQIPNLPADQVSSILNEPGMESFSDMGYEGHAASPARGVLGDEVQSEWNQEYEFPQSAGGQQPNEEQQVDETIEQFEERVLNKRAAQLFISVRSRLLKSESMVLSEMTYRNNKKQAAQKFYSLLVLKKFKALEIAQPQPYADITITRGPLFENPIL
ncbi:double-strand-break repair protein rad21 homolog isoform X2 [Toxorhynchites rutilus septentrionalis]|uniref:double-strand-break repair protein rad21 homolog isoform X2 n=1 Tax=Toxorhynchites rutilus septentrionalis TaxID=329112 RepID=UPI00247AB5BB|nr:double-strand-break repair protein rad21 homolog isoform X2 [Toxorhynchites rutilus septentrionalis]